MKLLMITRTAAEFAGIQGKLAEIARQGVDLTVVSPARWAGKDSELNHVRPDNYELIVHKCLLSGTSFVRLGNHLHFYPGIAKVIERDKWDLVHIDEEPFNFATYHALRACRRCGIPAIFASWQNSMKTYPPPFNLFEHYVFGNIAGGIAGNRDVKDVLRRRGFSRPVAHIPQLGVDPITFRKQDATPLRHQLGVDGTFVIGFVGRFWPVKAVDTLIKAFANLPADCSLVLVGSGSERKKLQNLAQVLGVGARIRWVPWVDSWDVARYMNAFDVLVLPSRTRWNIKEQFGRVLVEAMACETSVVGSDSGEIPRVVGDAGLIFHEDRELELAAHLHVLRGNPSHREEFGRRGRDRVLRHFTYSKIAEETVFFYKRVAFAETDDAQEPVDAQRTLAVRGGTAFSEFRGRDSSETTKMT